MDVNDNPPRFLKDEVEVEVVEEDSSHLPATIYKVGVKEMNTQRVSTGVKASD